MIDMCDVLITYFDKDYRLSAGRTSGTRTAVLYATKKNKSVNLTIIQELADGLGLGLDEFFDSPLFKRENIE